MNKKTIGGMGLAFFIGVLSTMGITSITELESSDINLNDTFYCKSRDLIWVCDQGLSSTEKRCYYTDNGVKRWKNCYEEPFWKPIEFFLENELRISPEDIYLTGIKLNNNGCIHSCPEGNYEYDLCWCDKGQWAYRGELR